MTKILTNVTLILTYKHPAQLHWHRRDNNCPTARRLMYSETTSSDRPVLILII